MQRRAGDAQRASTLQQQKAEKHQALAEKILDTRKVRQNARPYREDHGGRESNSEGVTRSTPDATAQIGKGSPHAH
jgi:hypothetical protein